MAGLEIYRPDEQKICNAIIKKFYDRENNLFVDGEEHRHISLVGNAFPFAFDISPAPEFEEKFLELYSKKGEDRTSLFTTFPILLKLTRMGEVERIKRTILHSGTWTRMLNEGATSTFEGWGKDTKWNTSLFHLTMSSAVIFMADIDLKKMIG